MEEEAQEVNTRRVGEFAMWLKCFDFNCLRPNAPTFFVYISKY